MMPVLERPGVLTSEEPQKDVLATDIASPHLLAVLLSEGYRVARFLREPVEHTPHHPTMPSPRAPLLIVLVGDGGWPGCVGGRLDGQVS
jgi:hypothetical protein